jgi:LysR family carnitine catabolism transcriptional activator
MPRNDHELQRLNVLLPESKKHLSSKFGPEASSSRDYGFIGHRFTGFQGVSVVLRDVVAQRVVNMVKAEEVDFGVGSAPGGDPDVRFTALLSDQMVVAFPARHPLRQCTSVKLKQLVRVPLVLMTADSSVRKLVDGAFASIGQLVMPAYEATYMSTAAGMVKAGLGVTILPSSAIKMGELAGLVTRPISRPAITRELGIIEKTARSFSPAAEAFASAIKAAVSAA